MTNLLSRKLDPVKIFQHATNFHASDHRLRSILSPDKPEDFLIAGPSMVLSAFASELHLKCLLCAENGEAPNEHNLKTLFLRLVPPTRRRLEELWDEDIKQPDKQADFNLIRSMPEGQNLQLDLLYALDIGANAFIELRYFYEKERAFFILGELPSMLRKVILEKYPHWAPTPATLPIGPIR